ncbi:MAG TPA: M48 family metalloprotease [Niastella sp.]
MSKYVQFILAITYALITAFALYLLWFVLSRGRQHTDEWIFYAGMAGWLLICFTTAWWYPDVHIFFNQVRKPTYEEEYRLVLCMHQIQRKANDKKRYRLRVEEAPGMNAYAIGIRTIVVSKDCLTLLSDEELCALLAHEMGHLRTKDCMAILAYFVANKPPAIVSGILKVPLKIAGGTFIGALRQNLLYAFILFIVLLFILSKTAILYYVFAVAGFIIFLWLLNLLFTFLWLLNSRYTEYRQDAFAHQLGYGLQLKQVLQKIVDSGPPQRVDQYSIIIRSTHPIIHNRIRRLEKLSGLRK